MENNKKTYERPERKIGEIFEYNGEWYQCVEYDGCDECSLRTTECGSGTKSDLAYEMFGHCSKVARSDNKHTIFKKLEKVGEPVIGKGRTFQRLIGFGVSCEGCIFNTEKNPCDKYHYVEGPCPDREIWVEIKQNEKDMEGKVIEDIKVGNKVICLSNNKSYFITETNCRMKYDGDWHDCVIYTPLYDNPYKCFVRPIKDFAQNFVLDSAEEKEEKYSNLESTGKNLKPFDLQKAKEGKPVCTRDGGKARIICFNLKNEDNTIVAAVGNDSFENLFCYTKNGKLTDGIESDKDLMMLPEKKEGWVNVYKERIYSTKEEAIDATYDGVTYVDTVKVCWEE